MIDLLKNVKCFLLDMDGTVHLSGVAIDGAAAAIERMRKVGRVVFLTNNTSVSRDDYVNKLVKMGIAVNSEDIYTAGNATIDYLHKFHKGKKVFLLGTDKLKAEFEKNNVLLDFNAPDICVIGFDTSLNYEKLASVCNFIRGGVPYLLTHPDINCPTINGYIPDAGSFNALIEMSTGKKPFIICGKPYEPIAEGVRNLVGCKSGEIAMFGDRLMTDMEFAIKNGFISVLVLTGEAKKSDLEKSGLKVDLVLDSIKNF